MKFGALRAVAHNIADSIADGNSFLFGVFGLDVFGEADRAANGHIDIDLIGGTCSETEVSVQLASVMNRSTGVLKSFCDKHHISPSAFRELSIRFFAGTPTRRFVVTIQNGVGRRSIDEYIDGKRPRILDDLGRVRKVRPGASYMLPASEHH